MIVNEATFPCSGLDSPYCQAMLSVLTHLCSHIALIDLESDTCQFLRSTTQPDLVGNTLPFSKRSLELALGCIVAEDLPQIAHLLDRTVLTEFYHSTEARLTGEFRFQAPPQSYIWVKLCLDKIQTERPQLLLTAQNINQKKMNATIIDLFIYQHCEAFFYLDVQRNYYWICTNKQNNVARPSHNEGVYTDEVTRFCETYVDEEDQSYTKFQMAPERIVEALNLHGEHMLYFGVTDAKRGYTRKRIKYLYYDKAQKMILGLYTDITDIYLHEEGKRELLRHALEDARTDSLTGLYNRKAFESLITGYLLCHKQRSMGAIFFIDVDNFKLVNDNLGHDMGDELLRFLAQKLTEFCPTEAIIGRLGGDEFLAFLPHVDSLAALKKLAQDICNSFEHWETPDLSPFEVSCSVGIALYPLQRMSYDDLVSKADRALYDSKRRGKQRYSFYTDLADAWNVPDMLSLDNLPEK